MSGASFSAGVAAANAGMCARKNPYSMRSDKGKEWHQGYRSVLLQGPQRPRGWCPKTGEERECRYCGAGIYAIASRQSGRYEKKFCSLYCAGKYHFGWSA